MLGYRGLGLVHVQDRVLARRGTIVAGSIPEGTGKLAQDEDQSPPVAGGEDTQVRPVSEGEQADNDQDTGI